ncbi:cytoplasmic protein [Paenibacillus sp. 7541]|uniref:Cytoplasmic protein n=2 Tax=Paenibacillus TaxID=44249 RepID=A0A268F4V6_9BACL|nr:DUF4176 domain-containing protein [Paenibacillus campinasensis]PAD80407.1 cytoplasmic protein [Paenibacillus campinasensis]PAK55389.1 cytoplasmic protein [Paenibacillus sp. 7541]
MGNPQTLLPNGSIVILKEGEKKLVIYGRKQILAVDEPQMFDYLACPYPEGYISPEFSYVFNHEDIQTVVFTGYQDEEEDEFQTVLANAGES